MHWTLFARHNRELFIWMLPSKSKRNVESSDRITGLHKITAHDLIVRTMLEMGSFSFSNVQYNVQCTNKAHWCQFRQNFNWCNLSVIVSTKTIIKSRQISLVFKCLMWPTAYEMKWNAPLFTGSILWMRVPFVID